MENIKLNSNKITIKAKKYFNKNKKMKIIIEKWVDNYFLDKRKHYQLRSLVKNNY